MVVKMLVIVDIHKADSALKRTIDYIDKYKPDLLLIAGDITTFGPLEYAEEFLAKLPNIRILALPGNCDPREILAVIDKSKAINLHGKKENINGIMFIGLGGSNATPFNTPFELSEDEIFQSLDPIMEPGAILVLHFPAKGHLDLASRNVHTGSISALLIIEKYKPSIVISGHIHETRGTKTDENNIIYLNPGPLQKGYAAIVDITPSTVKRYECKIQLLPVEN